MTIGFDAKRYFNNTTGLGFYSRTLVGDLQRLYPDEQFLLYSPYVKSGLAPPNLRLPQSALGRTLHPIWRNRWIVKDLQRDGVEVFHGMSHELPTGLRKAGIRGVVTMHDLIFIRYPELFPFIDRFFYQKKYRRAAEDADCIVAISEQTRQDLETFFQIPPARVRVIGQSCDPFFETLSLRHQPDRLALPLPQGVQIPEKDYFLAVGSLIPRKNWGRMFEALALLKKEGLDVPLVMVGTGKGAFADGLKAQAAQLGLSVFWLERHLPTRELALLCRRAAAMVYPSVFEGFGIPILEALTVGIPVVTSKGGCFEEVGGNAALYADPLSVEDIAAQMRRVLDSGVRNELIVNASEQVKLFSPEKICAAWMEVYQK